MSILTTAIVFYLIFFFWMNLPFMYQHRDLTHGQVRFSKSLAYTCKIITWSKYFNYTHYIDKFWVGLHMKHHQYSDTPNDPYKPTITWLLQTKSGYLTVEEVDHMTRNINFSVGALDQFLEKYRFGPYVLFVLCTLIFSWSGIILWLLLIHTETFVKLYHMLTHIFGYTHGVLKSTAKNTCPLGLVIGGEELHWNHHKWPNRANLAVRWYEVDTGFWILKFLSLFGLVTICGKSSFKDI